MSSFRGFGIIPAAGLSRRMGAPKLLLPFRGACIIDAVLSAWKESMVAETVVVCRADDSELIKAIQRHNVHCVAKDPPPADMKASVSYGLAYCLEQFRPNPDDCWLMGPADMPLLTSEVIDRLLRQYDPLVPRKIVATYLGKHGHPVLFPWSFADRVFALEDGKGINSLARELPTWEVECENPGVLQDLDTQADYGKLQERG